jgi:hypothetical protein
VGAAVVAALVVRFFPGRRPAPAPRLVRLGQAVGFRPFGDPLPGTGDGASVWVVPAADQPAFAATLAERLATRGPVLLLACPASRRDHWDHLGPGTAPVWIAEEARPSARRALAAAATLGAEGQVATLVIEGAGALEAVPAGNPTAALEEALGASPASLFVVVAEGDPLPRGPWPVVRLVPAEDGWVADTGARFVRRAWRFERASG